MRRILLILGLASCAPKVEPPPAPRERVAARSDLVYFVMVDRYADGDHWNNEAFDPADPQAFHGGDLQGVLQHLDEIDKLGTGTLWLSPFFELRDEPIDGWGGYHGYWTWDLDRVEPRFGGNEAARTLATEVHRRGIRLLLDMVYNHVGPGSPVLEEHPEWFHPDRTIEDWQDPEQVQRGWVHGLPDLDQDNPEVRDWLVERTLSWVDALAADGLRVDALRHLPAPFVRELVERVEAGAGRDLFIVGEDFTGSASQLAATLEATGVDAVYDFPLRYAMVDVFCKGASVSRLAATLSMDHLYEDANTQLLTFLDNHDLPRIASECADGGRGPEDLHQALAFLMSARGTPVIQYGTEIPLRGSAEPDNRRQMDFAAPQELAPTIREMTEARRTRPSLRDGVNWIFTLDEDLLGYARVDPLESAVILVNRSDRRRVLRLPALLATGSIQTTYHEIVGSQGPFLRHQAISGAPERERPEVGPYSLPPHSTTIGYLRPDAESGFAPLVAQLGAWASARRKVSLRVGIGAEGGSQRPFSPSLAPRDRLFMVGADPRLGGWEPLEGIPLYESDGALVTDPVELPLWSAHEFKMVVLRSDGSLEWEEGPNRSLLVKAGEEGQEVHIPWAG